MRLRGKEDDMPIYISLVKWTDQGMRNIKEAPQRVESFKKRVQAAGGKLTGFYLTMGRYDIVTIVDAPSDEAMVNIVLSTESKGNVRIQTLKASTEEQFRAIVAKIQ